jgi:hypothetical protein
MPHGLFPHALRNRLSAAHWAAVALATSMAMGSLAGAPQVGAAEGYRDCRGGVAVDATLKPEGFYRDFRARKVGDCGRARRTVLEFAETRGPKIRRGVPDDVSFPAIGTQWTCRIQALPAGQSAGGEFLPPHERIGCKAHGGLRVKFIGAG